MNSIDVERRIYELSVEDILTVIEEDELFLELNDNDIDFIEEKVAAYIDWRSAISLALSDLESSKKNENNLSL